MPSWVRYCVSVYLGLLLAGVLVGPVPQPSHGSFYLPLVSEPKAPTALATPAYIPPPRVVEPVAPDEREPDPSGTLPP